MTPITLTRRSGRWRVASCRQWCFHLSRASWQWLYDQIPDRFVQASHFKRTFGRDLNLAAPQAFNEKIQWLMLYHRIPEVRRLADKYEVRNYVAQQVGGWLLNDLYGVWDHPSALVFDQLPKSFVLKVTSGSGQNILCRDKSQLDLEKTQRKLAKWMKRSEYRVAREWCYKDIRPRIICERFLTDETGAIPSGSDSSASTESLCSCSSIWIVSRSTGATCLTSTGSCFPSISEVTPQAVWIYSGPGTSRP